MEYQIPGGTSTVPCGWQDVSICSPRQIDTFNNCSVRTCTMSHWKYEKYNVVNRVPVGCWNRVFDETIFFIFIFKF